MLLKSFLIRSRATAFSLSLFVVLGNGVLGSVQAVAQDATAGTGQATATGETVTLSFTGPETSEDASPNPFTDYRLRVTFTHGNQSQTVRGFYAADGDAAQTSAHSGNVWQCRWTTFEPGEWSYSAVLSRGNDIAINDDGAAGESVPLSNASGTVNVLPRNANNSLPRKDLRGRGRLLVDGHYFRFAGGGAYWMKAGTNSPENLLAYRDFDDTYRMSSSDREGEAKTTEKLHRFEPHLIDFREGDPTWKSAQGKSLMGAINYLSEQGMNAIYFLTMNIGGDGKDVWPYADPSDMTRFDCSKLDQWEIVFDHMQKQGMQMHVITQETENETLLDDGDTGRLRKLYYRELISRFAHHPAIVWNLGEENGPADFSPNGQTAAQQKAMADYIDAHDPYGNPILIHTHASNRHQDEILMDLLGHPSIDGLSLQVSKPKSVYNRVKKWRQASAKAGHPWAVSMDEIGPADTGAKPDADEPSHDSIRGPVLWSSLLAGGSGVEWYFGYKFAHNDLNAEDWRSRNRLWKQSRIAVDFLQTQVPFWEMQPADKKIKQGKGHCLAKLGETYVVYRRAGQSDLPIQLDLSDVDGTIQIQWLDPRNGGNLQRGKLTQVKGGKPVSIGLPPTDSDADWVALLTK